MAPDAPPMFANRYRARTLAKSEDGVATWLGIDVLTSDEVVIRVCDPARLPETAAGHLRRAADALAHLISPAAPLREFAIVGDELVFIRQFVKGEPLSERLAAGPLGDVEAARVGLEILEVLLEAQAQGLSLEGLHAGNVIVTEEVLAARVLLTDLGVTRASISTVRRESGPVSVIGWLLADCVAPGLIQPHLASDSEVQRIASFGELGALAVDCIRGVVGSPGDVRARLEQLDVPDEVSLATPEMVGRDEELALLVAAVARGMAGKGGLVTLAGESGLGKSRLLGELASRARGMGCLVLKGQGRESALRALAILEGVAEGLVAALPPASKDAAQLRQLLDCHGESLVAVLPRLRELIPADERLGAFDPRPRRNLDPAHEVHALTALTALLDGLGELERPCLMLLDDCHWADELTLRLLRTWGQLHAASPGKISRRLVVVAAFQSEEVGDAHPLRRMEPQAQVKLRSLANHELSRLVDSMAEGIWGDAKNAVISLSDGSPLVCVALLQELVDTGIMRAGRGGFIVDGERLGELAPLVRSGAVERRLSMLSEKKRALLQAGAVVGEGFPVSLAAKLAHVPLTTAARWIDEAIRRDLLVAGDDEGSALFVDREVRDSLLRSVSDEQRRQLHGSIARILEAEDRSRVLEIAHHFLAAGEHAVALPYAVRAAERARADTSLELAEHLYREAERGAAHAPQQQLQSIREALGEVLMVRGRYGEALEALQRARALALDPIEQARIEAKIGEVHFRGGAGDEARASLERCLRTLDFPAPPVRDGSVLPRLLWELLVQVSHVVFRAWPRTKREPLRRDAELVASRAYFRLPYCDWYVRGRGAPELHALWAHLKCLNLAERCQPTAELARAYAAHAICMGFIPWATRARRFGERALQVVKEARAELVFGYVQSLYGVALVSCGAFEESLRLCLSASAELERVGDRWKAMSALRHAALCLYRLGRLGEAEAICARIHRTCQELGDVRMTSHVLELWAKSTGGRLPSEVIAAARPSASDRQSAQLIDQAEAVCLLAAGETARAADLLDQTVERVGPMALRNEYGVPCAAWRLTALRRELERVESGGAGALRQRADRALRLALRLARSFRNDLPMVLREAALLTALDGKLGRAKALLDRSATLAKAQGARYEEAQTLLARARLGVRHGWASAAQDGLRARSLLRETQARMALGAPWSDEEVV